MAVKGGGPISILDIMDVPLTRYANDPIHPEDWIVDAGHKWNIVSKWDLKNLYALEEKPKDLWLELFWFNVKWTPTGLS